MSVTGLFSATENGGHSDSDSAPQEPAAAVREVDPLDEAEKPLGEAEVGPLQDSPEAESLQITFGSFGDDGEEEDGGNDISSLGEEDHVGQSQASEKSASNSESTYEKDDGGVTMKKVGTAPSPEASATADEETKLQSVTSTSTSTSGSEPVLEREINRAEKSDIDQINNSISEVSSREPILWVRSNSSSAASNSSSTASNSKAQQKSSSPKKAFKMKSWADMEDSDSDSESSDKSEAKPDVQNQIVETATDVSTDRIQSTTSSTSSLRGGSGSAENTKHSDNKSQPPKRRNWGSESDTEDEQPTRGPGPSTVSSKTTIEIPTSSTSSSAIENSKTSAANDSNGPAEAAAAAAKPFSYADMAKRRATTGIYIHSTCQYISMFNTYSRHSNFSNT